MPSDAAPPRGVQNRLALSVDQADQAYVAGRRRAGTDGRQIDDLQWVVPARQRTGRFP